MPVSPPSVYILSIIAGAIAGRVWDVALLPYPFNVSVGIAGVVLSGIVIRASFRELERVGTTGNPNREATILVTTGPFRWSRNPIYAAMTLATIGLAFVLNSAVMACFAYFAAAITQHFNIRKEEAAMEKRFKEAFLLYASRTRRWL